MFDISVAVRYTRPMKISVAVPTHLHQFVREQMASGLFSTEDDVIRAALCLLEDQSQSHRPLPPRFNQNPDLGPTDRSGEPASKEFWNGLRERLHDADRLPDNGATPLAAQRRSPRGILADLRSDICPNDIKEARREMQSGFPHSER